VRQARINQQAFSRADRWSESAGQRGASAARERQHAARNHGAAGGREDVVEKKVVDEQLEEASGFHFLNASLLGRRHGCYLGESSHGPRAEMK
jgi:hypothetical protein